jgi:hypothetical protein
MQRRRWLQWGLAGTATLAVLGGTAVLWQPAWVDGALSPSARTLVSALAQALLEGSLPAEKDAQETALVGLLNRTDTLIQSLPAHSQAELEQLLSLLAHPVGRVGLAGLRIPWTTATVAEVQHALQGMLQSTITLRQQAYLALHDIIGSAYFSDPTTWAQLGYPGPQAV